MSWSWDDRLGSLSLSSLKDDIVVVNKNESMLQAKIAQLKLSAQALSIKCGQTTKVFNQVLHKYRDNSLDESKYKSSNNSTAILSESIDDNLLYI